MRRLLGCSSLLIGAARATGAEPPPAVPAANTWSKLDQASLTGQRWDVPLGYEPELKRFLILGGRLAPTRCGAA